MSGPKYGYPYNNPDNYIFPETPLQENTEPDSPLTQVSNQEQAKDVYGNDTMMSGRNTSWGTGMVQDKLALGSELEPARFENPIAGGYYISGPIYCDTCNRAISPNEMSTPQHLGHNLRNDIQQPVDIDQMHKTGGQYRIPWEVRNDPTNPSGMGGDTEAFTTKPLMVSQKGEQESDRGYAFTETPNEGDYSWRPPIIEQESIKSLIFDEAIRINPDNPKVPNENTILADDDDRTVPM